LSGGVGTKAETSVGDDVKVKDLFELVESASSGEPLGDKFGEIIEGGVPADTISDPLREVEGGLGMRSFKLSLEATVERGVGLIAAGLSRSPLDRIGGDATNRDLLPSAGLLKRTGDDKFLLLWLGEAGEARGLRGWDAIKSVACTGTGSERGGEGEAEALPLAILETDGEVSGELPCRADGMVGK
jgi:hypothetical protein